MLKERSVGKTRQKSHARCKQALAAMSHHVTPEQLHSIARQGFPVGIFIGEKDEVYKQ